MSNGGDEGILGGRLADLASGNAVATLTKAETITKAIPLLSTSIVPMDNEDTREPRTLSDAAFLRIRFDIVTGALRPGAKLKIAELVERYGTGASPLREALARLSAEHLVDLEGHRGFTVASISRSEFEDLTMVRCLIERDQSSSEA